MRGKTERNVNALAYLQAEAELARLVDSFFRPATKLHSALENPTTAQQAARGNNAEARYRVLVEQIPAVTFMAALDGGVSQMYVSPQIEQMLGFSQQEWLADPILWHRRLHPEDQERWNAHFAPTCAAGTPFRAEYRFIARDGARTWMVTPRAYGGRR